MSIHVRTPSVGRLPRAAAMFAGALVVDFVAVIVPAGRSLDSELFVSVAELDGLLPWTLLRQSTWAFCALAILASGVALLSGDRTAWRGPVLVVVASVTSVLVRMVLPGGAGTGVSPDGVSTSPSTHSVLMFTSLAVLANLPARRVARLLSLSVSTALLATVGFANVATFAHLPSDVVVGYLWGAAWSVLFLTRCAAKVTLVGASITAITGGLATVAAALVVCAVATTVTGNAPNLLATTAGAVALWLASLFAWIAKGGFGRIGHASLVDGRG